MDAHPGEFVYATAGRDKGKCFIILTVEGDFLYLADGKSRKVSTPKRKKIKHVALTGKHDDFIKNKLETSGKLTNKEVRFSLSTFTSGKNEEKIS